MKANFHERWGLSGFGQTGLGPWEHVMGEALGRTKAKCYVALAGVAWGVCSFFVLKAGWDPVSSAWIRAEIAGGILLFWVAIRKEVTLEAFSVQLCAAILLAFSNILWLIGCFSTSVATVTLSMASWPLVCLGLERLTGRPHGECYALRPFVLAMIAIVLIFGADFHGSVSFGVVAPLFGAISFGCFVSCLRQLPSDKARLQSVMLSQIIAALMLCSGVRLIESPRPIQWAWLIALGVCTAAASIFWALGSPKLSSVQAGVLVMTDLPVSIGLAWLLLGQPISVWLAIGMVLLLRAVYEVTRRAPLRSTDSIGLPQIVVSSSSV